MLIWLNNRRRAAGEANIGKQEKHRYRGIFPKYDASKEVNSMCCK
jgi:hypothetical protein